MLQLSAPAYITRHFQFSSPLVCASTQMQLQCNERFSPGNNISFIALTVEVSFEDHILSVLTLAMTSSRHTVYPSLPVRPTGLQVAHIEEKFCTACHIHLYLPFTAGHWNHIRIYYHHADLAFADNTNHDKLEQWLHKQPGWYISSYEQRWGEQIPPRGPDAIIYLYG